jgi:hypothetical protein
MSQLIHKRASASRPSGEWDDDDYDVLADGVVVGRIHEGRRRARRNVLALDTPHADPRLRGYAATREAAVALYHRTPPKRWPRDL